MEKKLSNFFHYTFTFIPIFSLIDDLIHAKGFRKLNLLQIFGCSVHFSRYLYRSAAHPQEIKHGNVVYDFVFKKSVQKICRSSKPIYLGSKPGYFNFFHVYIRLMFSAIFNPDTKKYQNNSW